MKQHLILKIQSAFLNGSDISESIRKGLVLNLSNEIPIKRISIEEEPGIVAWENEYFKEMCNIKIENHVKRENKL